MSIDDISIFTDESEADSDLDAPTGEKLAAPSSKSKTVLVPKVQNMDDYLLKHYKSFIIQELNGRLANGELSEILEIPVRSDRILPGECCFQRFNYWRINQCDFWVDIDLRLELKIQTDAGLDTDFHWFYVKLWFSFAGDEEQCTFDCIGKLPDKPEYDDNWKLDKYLVPVLRRDEIDRYTEALWEEYYPEAARDGKLRNPRDLAAKMGLSLTSIPLHKMNHIKSVIFFRKSKALAQPGRLPGAHEDPPPQEVCVPENSIVLNTHSGSSYDYDLDIYHECIHYDWHYLFYRLQNMHNNDLQQLKMVRRTVLRKQDLANPIEFMEFQARYGSYGLMMPITFMRETITAMYKEAFANKRKNGNYDHDGRRYDVIARNIASEFMLSKARIRARMIQLGYTAAKGSLNYVDGKYIMPFAFSELESARGDETYVIDRKSVFKLYNTDKTFQQIMQTGHFAYVDGHVVHCDSSNIVRMGSQSQLSAWANAHIDRVSLRFSKVYSADHHYRYTFGQMNSAEAVKNTFKFLDLNGSMSVREAERAKTQLMDEMPTSFHGALAYIMKGRMTVEELERRIPLSRRQILRLRTEDRKKYELDQVIALCIGLNLPPWLSDILLEKAGLVVKRYGAYGYYGTILDCFYLDSMKEVQQFLSDNGYEPLKLNFDADE